VVSAAIFLSRISGLVREQVMGALFGASAESDAFVVAVRIPNLMRDLFAEGALSSAFIPAFTRTLANEGKAAAAKLSNLVAGSLVAIVGLISVLGMIFSPELVELFASGYHQIPGKFELTVRMTRIMFPFLLLVALAAQAMGMLNALNRFGVAALSSTFFNLGSVIFGLSAGYLAGPRLGIPPIVGMAYGVLCGGLWQLLWQTPSLMREGLGFKPSLRPAEYFAHPGLKQIFLLMGPALIGNAATQINVTVNTNFATSITDAAGHVMSGPASWLQYAFRFMQLPLGLFGVAIASATLPSISRSAAEGDFAEFRTTLARSLGTAMLLTVPSSVGLMVLGPSMISVVYERGRFHALDTHQTAVALSWYALGLARYAALKILAPAF
jgi:putative peptidoglycan lipid II flippase